MTMLEFLNTLISAGVLGAIYSLVTVGYIVVYRASRVFNFMHPQFMLLGVLLYTTFFKASVISFILAVLLSMVIVVIVSMLTYALVVDRASTLPHWVQMMLTLGLSIVSVNVIQLFYGSGVRFMTTPLVDKVWNLPGEAVLSRLDLAIIVTGVLLSAGLYWLLTKSPLAYRMEATAEDPTLAAYSAIPLRFWFSVAWGIAAAAAVVGGIAYSTRIPVDTSIINVGLLAFPAAMLGGMDSIHGSFIGAIILAVMQQFATFLWGSEIAIAMAFSVVVLVLVFRPRGLFGSPVVERV